MRVLFLFLFLLQLQLLPQLMAGVNTVSPHCPEECGEVIIPYPFGIGAGCFWPGFELQCNKTDDGIYKPFIINVEVINISLQSGQARIYNHVSSSCYENSPNSPSVTNYYDWQLNFTTYPYRFSNTLNKFTTVGCESLAYIISDNNNNSYQSGCLSVCRSPASLGDGMCSGMGCCQTSIPKGLNYYSVRFDERFNNSGVSSFSRCSYAFLVEDASYEFHTSDVTTTDLSERNGARVPIVVDWAIGGVSCDAAQANLASYACLSEHSECLNSINGPGYLCNCSSGYQGNPYLKNGCQDINECEHPTEYPCYGICGNLQGNYSCNCSSGYQGNPYLKNGCQDINECEFPTEYPCYGRCINSVGNYSCECPSIAQGDAYVQGGCTCPSGTQGDPYAREGCKPNSQRFPTWLIFAIGSLCIFVAISFAYIVFEKVKFIRTKQKYFRENGGLLLHEQINAYQGVKFKIFTRKQMERATMNFDNNQVLGKGGHGMVYKGILDDKRIVAIKKSSITGEKQKKEFIKEIYICSSINHKNVVRIWGCCLEVEVPLVVYEFISKGTLFEYIHDKNRRMSMDFCLKVATESAAALAYLHSGASPSILHGDVKSTNILLDDNLTPIVSDFGGSLVDKRESSCVHITEGYRDPESLETGETTQKSDVYSFAVVLLELLTRRMVLQSNGSKEKTSLVSLFNSSLKENGLVDILDDEIKSELQKLLLEEFTELLKQCLSYKGENRPTMKEVAAWLERLRKQFPQVKCMQNDTVISITESSSYHAEGIAKFSTSENQNIFCIDDGR